MSPHAVDPDIPPTTPTSSSSDDIYDLICVGFGPASLSIAIALHDALETRRPLPGLHNIRTTAPKVLFLERQEKFGWHTGMLLPGTKMQISFVKDLATMRDPRSHFTFLNYLHEKGRLAQFTNLDTFTPQRREYADYMGWCASHFEDSVQYSQEVVEVTPHTSKASSAEAQIDSFDILARDLATRSTRTFTSRNVVLAMGGQPSIPASFPLSHPRVLHSSNYAHSISKVLPDPLGHYNVAIVGSGQSAAECFHDLRSRFPNTRTRLLIRGEALKPSDDSPFVNELFDSGRVSTFYARDPAARAAALADNRGTNYGVVQSGLLQNIYDTLYMQRLGQGGNDERKWQHRILTRRRVIGAEAGAESVTLDVRDESCDGGIEDADEDGNVNDDATTSSKTEILHFDAVIVAAGYSRDMHQTILAPLLSLLPHADDPSADKHSNGDTISSNDGHGFNNSDANNSKSNSHTASHTTSKANTFAVRRDYSIPFPPSKVSPNAGVWLQGCNESSHGLSDTLLSILATRGGELVESILGDGRYGGV